MKRAYKVTLSGTGESAEVMVNGQATKRIRGCSGGYRLVASFGGLIIKIDHDAYRSHNNSYDVYCQTKSELDAYGEIDAEDLKYFPEILAYGSIKHNGAKCYWLIEPMYIQDQDLELDEDGYAELRRLCSQYGLGDLDTGHTADVMANWMITEDNQIMIYDFAL
jgi:hypothetical protein